MTAHQKATKPNRWPSIPPQLNNGDRLSLAEFNHLYTNSPKIRRAELIEGVVYVASPVYLPHSTAQGHIIGLLFMYQAYTPGTKFSNEQSVELDDDNAVQPDGLLWVDGDVEITKNGLLIGSPSLVVEVAFSTRSYDLSTKKQVYRRNRVQEYLVLSAFEKKTFWFRWDEGAYVEIEPDENDVYRSTVFPGLWLDSAAFWREDSTVMLQTLNAGLDSAEHAQFVQTLTT